MRSYICSSRLPMHPAESSLDLSKGLNDAKREFDIEMADMNKRLSAST